MPNFFCALARLAWIFCCSFALGMVGLTAQAAPLPKGALLTINPGHIGYPEGACSGSYVRYLNNESINCYPIGPGTDGGLVIGKDQKSGGQELGPSTDRRQAGQLSSAFTRQGYASLATASMHGARGGKALNDATLNRFDDVSCSGAACLGKVEINTLHQAYNGYAIPGGCAVENCASTGGSGVKIWEVKPDRSYLLDATWGSVQVHLEGAIVLPGNTQPQAMAVKGSTFSGEPVHWKPLVFDADADKLRCELLRDRSSFYGALSLAPDCTDGIYTPPNAIFTGLECRLYQVSDGKNVSNPAELCVKVLPKPLPVQKPGNN